MYRICMCACGGLVEWCWPMHESIRSDSSLSNFKLSVKSNSNTWHCFDRTSVNVLVLSCTLVKLLNSAPSLASATAAIPYPFARRYVSLVSHSPPALHTLSPYITLCSDRTNEWSGKRFVHTWPAYVIRARHVRYTCKYTFSIICRCFCRPIS